MQHAPITTPITDKLASMTWIRWFRQLVDRVDEIKGTADAPAWDSITGKPDEFPPETHTHPQYIETETDPTVPEYVKDITEDDLEKWRGSCQISGVTGSQLGDLSLVGEWIFAPAFRVRIFEDAAFLTVAKEYDVPAQQIPAPGIEQRFYLCAQRSGETVALVSIPQANVYTINMSNIVPLWRFEIHGTELHQIHYDNMGDGLPNKQEFAQLRTEPYRLAVEGGFVVTLGSGRSLTMTGAEVFFGHHRVTVGSFSSATDTVHDFYHVAGVWDDTETAGGWAWPNTTYDDGTDLVTMGNNKWGCLFVYRSIGDSNEIFTVRGRSEANTLESARLIGIPPTPDLIQWHTMLIGRILFQKSATTGVFEPYRPADFVRSQAPSLALNDLTDVDTAGPVTGDILVLQSDNIWRPQTFEPGAVAASRIIDRFAMYGRGSSRERDIIYDSVRNAVIWATGAGISRSLDGGVTISTYAPGYTIGSGSWLSWDEGRSRALWIPYDSNTNGYYSTDGGATWTNIANLNRGPGGFPRSQPRFMSIPSNGRLVRVGTYYGEIDYSDDAGVTWTDTGITVGGIGEHSAVGYDPRGFLWIIRGDVFSYSTNGSSWTSSAIGLTCTCVCVVSSGAYAGRFVVCREDGAKVRYSSDPRSVAWATPTNGFTLNLPKTVFHIPNTDLLAIISNNQKALAYSNDGGFSWTQYSDILGTNNGVERPTQTSFGSVCFMHAAADGATVTALRWGP